jgi:hypothetical protein
VRRGAAILTIVATFGLVLGCRSAAKHERDAPAKPQILVLLEQIPARGALAAGDFGLMRAGTPRFVVLDNHGDVERTIELTAAMTDRFEAGFSLSEPGVRTEFYREDDQGNIVMTAVHEAKDGAISLFEPPLVVAYRELPAQVKRTSKAAMRVMDAQDPTRQREQGRATRSMVYAADQRIRTPLGEFIAKRVEIHFRADLSLAKADERTTLFIVPAPGPGNVAQRSSEEVKVLGAFGRTQQRTLVLTESATRER